MKKFLKAKDTKAAIAACPALTGTHQPQTRIREIISRWVCPSCPFEPTE